MKRDMDLVRKILKEVEDCKDPYGLQQIPEIAGYSKSQISYHIRILCAAELIEAQSVDEMGVDYEDFREINITWAGQDFIDAANDDTLWSKAKETIIKPGASFTFDILLEWLKMKVKEKIGLP